MPYSRLRIWRNSEMRPYQRSLAQRRKRSAKNAPAHWAAACAYHNQPCETAIVIDTARQKGIVQRGPGDAKVARECCNCLWCSLLAALFHPSPGRFGWPLAGGGAPGRHPLICRFFAAAERSVTALRPALAPARAREPPPRRLKHAPQLMRLASRYWLLAPPLASVVASSRR